MQKFNMAGCTGIVAIRSLPIDSDKIKAILKEKINEGSGIYDQYNPRALIACYPATAGKNSKAEQGVEQALRGAGGFIIWNTHSAHNPGKGMNIWLIPGTEAARLYEGAMNGKKVCQPEPDNKLTDDQKRNVIALNTAQPAKEPGKKKINWKQRYNNLRKKILRKNRRG